MSLAPGDLCVIVPTPVDSLFDKICGAHGTHVVLIEVCACDECMRGKLNPYWRASGLPSTVHSVGHQALRRIPPAPMEREVPDLMEMVRVSGAVQ